MFFDGAVRARRRVSVSDLREARRRVERAARCYGEFSHAAELREKQFSRIARLYTAARVGYEAESIDDSEGEN